MKLFVGVLWTTLFVNVNICVCQDENDSTGDGSFQIDEVTREEGILVAQDSACTQFWIDFCVVEAFRYCYIDEELETERCGACLPGSFEWKTMCVSSAAFQLQTFLAEFTPVYLKEIPEEDRLEFLRLAIVFIVAHHSKNPPPLYELSLTPFSADGPEDTRHRQGFLPDEALNQREQAFRKNEPRYLQEDSVSREKVDWRTAGVVTSVKDQSRCGCCWAVSLAGAIEGATARNTGYLQSLSWQQLVSCDDQNFGCNGGSLVYAMQYAIQNSLGGIATDSDYPYTDSGGSTTESCQVTGKIPAVQVTEADYVVDFYDEFSFQERLTRMKRAIEQQPVAIVIRSNCQTISNYHSGILTEDEACACNDPMCADHAVLLVGYDDTTSPPCWIIKNSWGTRWYVNARRQKSKRSLSVTSLGFIVQANVLT